MSSDTIVLLANLALTLSFIVGLFFGIAQVKAAARDRRERLTLETLRSFQTREFAELIHFVNEQSVLHSREEWQALPAQDRIMLLQFSQQMESLGILVAERFVNIELVDKTLGDLVTTSWEKYRPVVYDLRAKLPDPFLSEYFQWLAERLNERMELRPRTPFHELPRQPRAFRS